MEKKEKNIFLRFFTNIFVKNLLLMAIIAVVLVAGVLIGLSYYTKHNEWIAVPNLKGLQIEEAGNILRSTELKYEIVSSLYDTGQPPGSIVEQIPKENSNIKKGRKVFLYIQAEGEQMISIPDLKDMSRRQAESQLNTLGFTDIKIAEVPSVYKGLVISLSYEGKEVVPGQKIPKGAPLRMTVGAGGESVADSIPSIPENVHVENSFFE